MGSVVVIDAVHVIEHQHERPVFPDVWQPADRALIREYSGPNQGTADTWLLDSAQMRLLVTLPPAAFDGDRGQWGLSHAQAYALLRNGTKARAYADSARLAFESQLLAAPGDPGLHASLGLALAHLVTERSNAATAERLKSGHTGVAIVAR